MKFFTLFAAGAMAASVTKRSTVDGVISDIQAIQSATSNLDSAIKAIVGASSKDAVISASNKVLSAIGTATTDADALPDITSLETALEFSSPVSALAAEVSTTINDLIAKKSTIVSAGLGGTTEQQLLAQQSAAEKFATTLTGKVPTAAAPIASSLSAPILASLQQGVDAFKGLSDSGSSSSSSAASSAASSVASSASSAASSAASSVSSAASSAAGYPTAGSSSSSAASATSSAYSTGSSTSNSTAPAHSTAPYTGGAAMNVAGFGGVLAAAALVAAF